MTETAEEQRARLAYDASPHALEQQQRVLEEIRSRTGILLAAASLSASFLGARVFSDHGSVALSVLALIALVVTLVLGTLVLAPRAQVIFSVSGTVLYEQLLDVDDCTDQHRYLASWLDKIWEANEPVVRGLTRRFEVAAGALVLQILFWALAIGDTL